MHRLPVHFHLRPVADGSAAGRGRREPPPHGHGERRLAGARRALPVRALRRLGQRRDPAGRPRRPRSVGPHRARRHAVGDRAPSASPRRSPGHAPPRRVHPPEIRSAGLRAFRRGVRPVADGRGGHLRAHQRRRGSAGCFARDGPPPAASRDPPADSRRAVLRRVQGRGVRSPLPRRSRPGRRRGGGRGADRRVFPVFLPDPRDRHVPRRNGYLPALRNGGDGGARGGGPARDGRSRSRAREGRRTGSSRELRHARLRSGRTCRGRSRSKRGAFPGPSAAAPSRSSCRPTRRTA